MLNKDILSEEEFETQIQDEEKDISMISVLMRNKDVAYLNMVCSVCGFFVSTHIDRLEKHFTSICSTCQSVYSVRVELRERKEPPYKC